jgi:N,N'-diacetyllegionaminate synthase
MVLEIKSTYVLAEMACSHEGQVQLAKDIIDGAGKAGADAIQLQVWSLPEMMVPTRPEYDLVKGIEFSHSEWREIVAYSKDKFPRMGIYIFIYEHKSVEFTESLDIDGYKLSSSDLSNFLMIDSIADTGKPINLSIGASSLGEIQNAVERIKRRSKSKITLMYGYQNFPTKINDIHLNYMLKLGELFELPVGYQDHCDAETEAAFFVPATAVGMGINVMEKHITHDRSLKGIDHESALNPDEYIRFVNMIRELDSAKGMSIPKPFSTDELKYRTFQKKSIVACRQLEAGTVIQTDDLLFLRADTLGLAPDQIDNLIGKKLKKEVAKYEIIIERDLA